MPGKYAPLSQPQLDVLQWVSQGCVEGEWEGHAHKIVAQALANRNLITIRRVQGRWTASMLPEGDYYVVHGEYNPATNQRKVRSPIRSRIQASQVSIVGALEANDEEIDDQPPDLDLAEEPAAAPWLPAVDATTRAMHRLARRHRNPVQVVSYQKEIPMRFTVVATRVQTAERSVHASDEESAARKVQDEFDRPYGYFGTWKTVSSEVEVTEREAVLSEMPGPLRKDGALLLSIKESGKVLGISYATVYELVNRGDLEHVSIGSRKYVSREALLLVIETNTHRGFH